MKPDRPERPRRFYRSAAAVAGETGWGIELDGRPLRTPAGAALVLPGEALARAVAAEWEGQGSHIDIKALHLKRLANVAIDRTPAARQDLVREVVRYCETDLTCFLSPDPDLRDRQDAVWKPWRDWAGRTLSVVLVPVEGLMASPQPAASLEAAEAVAAGADDFALTGLVFGCGLYGSAVLAFGLAHGAITAGDAFDASVIEETLQNDRWGEDAEAAMARAARRAESDALGAWFAALSAPEDVARPPDS